MNTNSFFSVVLVALVASHGGWALAKDDDLCDQDGLNSAVPRDVAGGALISPPTILECAVDDPLCTDDGLTVPTGNEVASLDAASRVLSPIVGPSLSECFVQGNEPPPPPPPTPSSGDPEPGTNSKSLDGQHYVEYTLDGDGGWTGYRATLDLAPDAAGTFASLDFRGTGGQVSEVRIALVTDASGARWAAATAVDLPELGVALVPVHDDHVSLTLRFGSGALGMAVDGQAASLALPPGTDVEVVRVGHFAVDTGTAPVLAITSPRFLRIAH